MYTHKALEYFGRKAQPRQKRQALAEAAGVTRQTVLRWMQSGCVPLKNALKLAEKSHGRVPVELEAYEVSEAPTTSQAVTARPSP